MKTLIDLNWQVKEFYLGSLEKATAVHQLAIGRFHLFICAFFYLLSIAHFSKTFIHYSFTYLNWFDLD